MYQDAKTKLKLFIFLIIMVLITGTLLLFASYKAITGYIIVDKTLGAEKNFGKNILNLILVSGLIILGYVGTMKIWRKSVVK